MLTSRVGNSAQRVDPIGFPEQRRIAGLNKAAARRRGAGAAWRNARAIAPAKIAVAAAGGENSLGGNVESYVPCFRRGGPAPAAASAWICPVGWKGAGVNFSRVIEEVCGRLDAAGIRYALIGGFAMALRGVQRATMDLDFIRMLLQAAGQRRQTLDWELLQDYLQLFGLEQRLGQLKSIYGPVE